MSFSNRWRDPATQCTRKSVHYFHNEQMETSLCYTHTHTHRVQWSSHVHIFRENPSICPSCHSSMYVHGPPSELSCCSCVHYSLMPELNKGLCSGDSGGVTGLNWAEIKCPCIERRNSLHGDFPHATGLIRVYESCLKVSNTGNTSRLQYKHVKLLRTRQKTVFLLRAFVLFLI